MSVDSNFRFGRGHVMMMRTPGVLQDCYEHDKYNIDDEDAYKYYAKRIWPRRQLGLPLIVVRLPIRDLYLSKSSAHLPRSWITEDSALDMKREPLFQNE